MIFGDLSAYVFIIDGQELSEYNVIVSSTPTENRITCWIASEEGKKFGVRWTNAVEQSWGFRAGVSVDGVHCVGQTVRPGWVGTRERTYLSNDSVTRDFMFSNIQLTDDDSMLGDQNSSDIGHIVLKVETGEYVKKQVVNHGKSKNCTLRVREGKVHERSKKACAHRVIFGEEVPRQVVRHRLDRSTFHNSFKPDNRPTTVFVFKYTRLDILQAMGIAPSTSKNSSKEVIDYGDDIEIIDGPYEPSKLSLPPKDIKPRIQHLEIELQRLRAQLASSEERKPSRVKLECEVSRRQQAAVEILDLTED
ncbi:hypothetical protein CY34DRAFT_798556 [Suillus luteus UH-Slu-Lm8-n1]|uniref:DUF7918 domain-containing protein n=1 Tax=Suillus luteus UH-Slu-Lm8-n1 TaxID=930992 RepID=A0A0D0B2D9_9AGAM|nr:hypothetical protein CY34DRAFT_798556 [Suillus luteus UH-Slu-Lm8-n1]